MSGSKSFCKCVFGSISVICILAFAALIGACFISTIISFATTWGNGFSGWDGIEMNCSETLRNTMLVVIICQFVCGGWGGNLVKNEWYGTAAIVYVGTFATLGGVLSSYYHDVVEAGGACNIYMDDKTSFNSPGNVYMYQIATSWIFAILGIFVGLASCLKSVYNPR